MGEADPAAGQAAMVPEGAGRRFRLASPVTALVLGGLVLVLLIADVPLAGLAHQGLNASFYMVADYRLRHGGLPFGWVALLAQPGWAPAIVMLGTRSRTCSSCCWQSAGCSRWSARCSASALVRGTPPAAEVAAERIGDHWHSLRVLGLPGG